MLSHLLESPPPLLPVRPLLLPRTTHADQSPERPRHILPSAGSRRGAKAAGGTANGRLPGWMTGSVTVRPADSQQGRTIGRLPS